MKIYHGSNNIVEKPRFGQGYVHNDYGRGFYCTDDKELAGEWACRNGQDGFINEYELSLEDKNGKKLKVLDLRETGALAWVAVLIEHRHANLRSEVLEESREYIINNFAVKISGYDVIVGYRADDSFFTIVRDFLLGNISLRSLAEALEFGNLGLQTMIRSKTAFQCLEYKSCQPVAAKQYYEKYKNRDEGARSDYQELRRRRPNKDDILMVDIWREEMGPDDSRLQKYISG